jgi:phosphoribosylformylglycinamidine synthase
MAKTKVLVLRAAGINCDEETQRAWELAGATAERVHINRLIERPERLSEFDIFTIPGGFSYGDDISAGRILALQLETRLGDALRRFIDDGRFVLGICNGFQALVKAGLLPGAGFERQVTIARNALGRYEDRWVRLRVDTDRCPFLEKGEMLAMPVGHGEGRVTLAPGDTLDRLRSADLVAFRYVAAGDGPAEYPANPNGSDDDIAGLIDVTGRVVGLMPHPDRHLFGTQHPTWTRDGIAPEADGLRVFRRIVGLVRV